MPRTNRPRFLLVVLNIVGGLAVLGSYAWGILANPETASDLWGAVPGGLVPLYTASMLTATAGYFLFTSYFLLRIDPDRVRFFAGPGFGLIQALYTGILLPSALWMPMTFVMLETPSTGLWWAIRLVLFAVGASSLGLLAALLRAEPRTRGAHFALAVVGLVAFCFQTAVLDALVWPFFF